jgi:prevent-host-death family protein
MKKKPGKVREAAVTGYIGVSATEFKAKCLEFLDRVQQTREEIVITKHGKPMGVLVPYPAAGQKLFGHLAGSVEIHGDIVGPTGERWDADA